MTKLWQHLLSSYHLGVCVRVRVRVCAHACLHVRVRVCKPLAFFLRVCRQYRELSISACNGFCCCCLVDADLCQIWELSVSMLDDFTVPKITFLHHRLEIQKPRNVPIMR